MCGCLVALAAFISPRLAIFLIWLFTDRMSIAFDSFWWGFLGFIFLPWTTLAWTVAYAPIRGVTGFGWFIVVFAFARRHHDPRRQRAGAPRPAHAHARSPMIPIGWFGVGSGALADAEGVGRHRTDGRGARVRVDLGGRAPGAHRPARTAVAVAAALRAHGPGAGARVRGRGHVAHHARHRHRDPAVAQPGDPGQGARHDRRAVARSADRRHRRRLRARRVRGHRRAVRHAGAPAPTSGSTSLRTLWRDDQPELRGDFASFGGIQCRPQPHRAGGPPILGSGMSTPRSPPGRRPLRRAGTASSRTSTTRGRRSTSSTGSREEVDRPAELGPLEITIIAVPGPVDRDTVRRYEDLGVDRLVLVQDFGDMAGGPDAGATWQVPGRDGGVRRASRHPLNRNEASTMPSTDEMSPRSTPRSKAGDADAFVAVLAPGAIVWHNHDRKEVDARDNMAAIAMLGQIVDGLPTEHVAAHADRRRVRAPVRHPRHGASRTATRSRCRTA